MDEGDKAICLQIAKNIGAHMTEIHISNIQGFLYNESKSMICPSCSKSGEIEVLWKIDNERESSKAHVKCHGCGFRSEDRNIPGAKENCDQQFVEIRAFFDEFKVKRNGHE